MTDPERPDPEALLDSLRASGAGEEASGRPATGKLKIFLGMCPGVGKTFAMLSAARARQRSGVDVVVGVVETHGRSETARLLDGLEVLPPVKVAYRGVELAEFDLDGALARRPALLLVDELAHTNAPGRRHERRWQDVRELLDAGIHVWTTLNIQHVESRAGTVGEITGVTIRETVPDSLLDRAELELVDLPPADLRQRLTEGKVYLGDRAGHAAENFFREANLTALREMALRLVAEHAGHDTRTFRRQRRGDGPWKSGHRLMVGVGPSPHSAELVRWTRRFADSLGCPWVAVHVETTAERQLSDDQLGRITRHLELARELGAEVVVSPGADWVGGLLAVAGEVNATHLIVGKPGGNWWQRWRSELQLVRLVRRTGGLDVHVVRVQDSDPPGLPAPRDRGRVSWPDLLLSAGVVAAATALCAALDPLLGPRALVFVYLVSVVALALVVGRAGVLVAAGLSALLWNLLFLPPRFTLLVRERDDVVLLVGYVGVALLVGRLVQRLRSQEEAERERERRTRTLYELTRGLAEARTREEVVWMTMDAIHRAFGLRSGMSLPDAAGAMVWHPDSPLQLDAKEQAVVDWAARHRCSAGRFTDNLPGSQALHVPMTTDRGVAGVLSLEWTHRHPPTLPQRELMDAVARHASLVLDRLTLQRDVERGRLAAESERLARALLDSVSHELRTPLTVLATASGALRGIASGKPGSLGCIADEIAVATDRLGRVVGHLLDMGRVESGAVQARCEWTDPRDVVHAVTAATASDRGTRPWSVTLDPALPLVWMDAGLTQQALINLVHNACVHTPSGGSIDLWLEREGEEAVWTVADRGAGVPEEELPRIFAKFHRARHAPPGGTGLGLAIVQGFAVAQQGRVSAGARPGGGAVFRLHLPYRTPPQPPT